MAAAPRVYRDVLTANATGRAFSVQSHTPADVALEPVSIVVTGTFSGATVTLHVSNSLSPQVYAATATTWTAAGAKTVELVTGTQFRVVVTSSGSPQSSLVASYRGQIAIAS